MKKYTVKMTPESLYDILEIVNFIQIDCDNVIAAAKYIEKFRKAIKNLSYMPASRAIIDEKLISRHGIRRVKVGEYVMFYGVDEDNLLVTIYRVKHKMANWKNLFN